MRYLVHFLYILHGERDRQLQCSLLLCHLEFSARSGHAGMHRETSQLCRVGTFTAQLKHASAEAACCYQGPSQPGIPYSSTLLLSEQMHEAVKHVSRDRKGD